jgi:tyrosyl-tRNA synthetase
MGGTDQKFNLLVAREIQRDFGQAPQIIATVPVLEGLDGIEKMSKSKGNYIGITEPPKVMFRKVMGISDELMWRYWELLTDKSLAEISAMKAEEPMQVKMRLASLIVADFHSAEAAEQAQADFDREVRRGAAPADIEVVELPAAAIDDRVNAANMGVAILVNIDKLNASIGLADSVTDAARKRKAGAVRIGEREELAPVESVTVAFHPGVIYDVRVGKKWKRVQVP